ncbi:MAG TPA: endopeptidase La, partial [Bacteroidetes bacterium]|nr:endopeptidase La [Bacteroidota bacterium]
NHEIHIHVPEGAIPKDGPSAGITMALAMVSAIMKKAVYRNIAMTGEITLRGHVLPIGGLNEKLLDARRAGIKTVLIPAKNEKDLTEVPQKIKKGLDIKLINHMDDVLRLAMRDGFSIS